MILPLSNRTVMSSLQPLQAALETLLAPTASDDWPEAVNRTLLSLLGADVAIFRLSDRGPAWVEPALDAAEARAEYRRAFRPLDPWARHATRPGEAIVQTAQSLLGGQAARNRYVADFLLPFGIHDYFGVQLGTTPGAHAHFGAYRTASERVRDSEERQIITLLRTLLPGLQSGVRAWRAARPGFTEFGAVLDEFGDAALLCDEMGRELHANRALVERCDVDPDGHRIRSAMADLARDVATARGGDLDRVLAETRGRVVSTQRARYRIHCVAADGLLGPRSGFLVVLDGGSPVKPPLELNDAARSALDDVFGLTPREIQVAERLARGESNLEVAAALGVSPNTAQTHTKRVLAKLGTRSRAGVHAIISR